MLALEVAFIRHSSTPCTLSPNDPETMYLKFVSWFTWISEWHFTVLCGVLLLIQALDARSWHTIPKFINYIHKACVLLPIGMKYFLHNTSRREKIDIWQPKYHYARDRVRIAWSLWHHQQSILTSSTECKPSEWDMGSFEDHRFISIYGIRYIYICRTRKK